MTQVAGLLVVALLVAASAYFVAMEFSFTAASRNKLVAAGQSGDAKSVAAVKVLRRLSFTLSGAQLGITVAALVTGFIARPVFAAVVEPALGVLGVPEQNQGAISLTVGFVVSTVALMVLGELAPKNLAIAIPEKVARSLAELDARAVMVPRGAMVAVPAGATADEVEQVARDSGRSRLPVHGEDLVEELIGDFDDPTERLTGLRLPAGEFDTLAGWLLLHLRRVAQVGDVVRADGLVARVLTVEGARIDLVSLVADDDSALVADGERAPTA